MQSYNYGGWGYYTDEGSRDEVFSFNIAARVKCAGHHQHYGTDNVLTNNIYANVNIGDVVTPGKLRAYPKGARPAGTVLHAEAASDISRAAGTLQSNTPSFQHASCKATHTHEQHKLLQPSAQRLLVDRCAVARCSVLVARCSTKDLDPPLSPSLTHLYFAVHTCMRVHVRSCVCVLCDLCALCIVCFDDVV